MAARPKPRVRIPRPATCPLVPGYLIALWSNRPPRVYMDRGPEVSPYEIRTRRRPETRTGHLPCLSVRLSVGGRQVSRTLLRLLAETVAVVPIDLPRHWSLVSLDGSCSVSSLRWASPSAASRLHRTGQPSEDMRRVVLRYEARACTTANDAEDGP